MNEPHEKLSSAPQLLRTLIFVFLVLLGFFLVFDLMHINPKEAIPQSVSFGMVHDGRLGDTIRRNGLVSLEREDFNDGGRKVCAAEKWQSNALPNYRYTATITVHSDIRQSMKVSLGPTSDYEQFAQKITINKGIHSYRVGLNEPRKELSSIRIWIGKGYEAALLDVRLDGYLFPRVPILVQNPSFDTTEAIKSFGTGEIESSKEYNTIVEIEGDNPYVEFRVPETFNQMGWQNSFFQKSRKNTACQYEVTNFSRRPDPSVANSLGIPHIEVVVDEDDLTGSSGLLNNKVGKGFRTEKLATAYFVDDGQTKAYSVGLRFHGGEPGRKRELESFRLYFRSKLNRPSGFFEQSNATIPTLVLKYTKLARVDGITDDNPFAHAFALDVGRAVDAIVPRSRIVNLTVNGENKGLYLAMDYLSERGFDRWLNDTEYNAFIYKRDNDEAAEFNMRYTYGQILRLKGEDTLEFARSSMSIDNVINSMILSSYIGDNDFCQGVDLITRPEKNRFSISIINWDLDHGFILKDKQTEQVMKAWELRSTRPMTSDIALCPRLMVMRHLYHESAEFRTLYAKRLNELFNDRLSVENLKEMLMTYKDVNKRMAGKYDRAINDLEEFITHRQLFILEELAALNQEIEAAAK